MHLYPSSDAYAAAREALLGRIAHDLSTDDRFVAAWLAGSLGRNEADAVSDLDLAVVVDDPFGETLCARPRQVGAGTTEARMALIGRFGCPAVIHENHHNAPGGGTFTFVLYADSALMVDWTLIPRSVAQRPPHSRLLFDKVGVPASPPSEPEPLDRRLEMASERVAFFWLMAAVTAKYIARGDSVTVQWMLDRLHDCLREVERLIAGEARRYRRGSLARLQATREDQIRAVRRLGEAMLSRMDAVASLGGHVPTPPMSTLEVLLQLSEYEAD